MPKSENLILFPKLNIANIFHRKYFNQIIGFTEKNFVPHMSTTFLVKLTQKIFIECFSVIRSLPSLLKEEEGLGAHTSVILLSPTFGLRYFWCHDTVRPYGDNIPQCTCGRVRQFRCDTINQSQWTYKLTCSCGWTKVKDATIPKAVLPKAVNGKVVGWGDQLLYGTRIGVREVREAPRELYNTI